MEGILGVQCQTTDFRAQLVSWDVARFGAIPIQAQAAKLGSRELYGVPLEHQTRLRRVPASKHWRLWGLRTKYIDYLALQRGKLLVGDRFGLLVARNIDIDDTAGLDVGRQEYRRELDLHAGQRVRHSATR